MRRPISCTSSKFEKKKRFKWHDHGFERQPLRMKENILDNVCDKGHIWNM